MRSEDSDSSAGHSSVALERSAKLQRRLRGDLDDIVLRALRKEPQLRYASVEQFADDIRRHLDGLPVIARKGSWHYRAGKFVRRHRLGIAASSVVLLSLLIGVAATVRQARIARQQAEIAKAQRAQAERRFQDVRELANSLIFEIHDSIQSLPGATPSRKLLLDRAVQYLDKLSQDAGNDANLQRELAWAYQRLATVQGDTSQSNLGEIKAADLSNKKAMALFEAVARANPDNVTDQLNLAMAYRWRAFYDIFETTGLAEIQRALAVTDPLMQRHSDNLDVENERAQELMILAAVQTAMGDRLKGLESYRSVLSLRLQIQRTKADYPGISAGIAKTTVMLAHMTAKYARREDGLRLMNEGLAEYAALLNSQPDDPIAVRELSAAEGRLGEIQTMMENYPAAIAAFRRSRQRIERLAKLDPANKMIQSDLSISEYLEGRALALAGRNSQALHLLEHAFKSYMALNLEADVGPGPAPMQAWVAEVQAVTGNTSEALRNYAGAAAGLTEDQNNFDDARCDLAMVKTKIADLLAKTGRLHDAETEYSNALDIANVAFSLEHGDIPSLYAAAEAYNGLAQIEEMKARRTPDAGTRGRLLADARTHYRKSLDLSKQIADPSRLTGSGYLATDPRQIALRLAKLDEQNAKQNIELGAVK